MATPMNTRWISGEENGFPRPFGNYLLLAAFAQGGMGELFLAMNGTIAGAFRLCILKKLRPDLTTDREYVNRFIDEARVVVQLNHANISHVFDVGRIDGQYYLAMEYVSGVSVKALMQRAEELKTPIPEDVSLFIALDALEALDYAHNHTHPITGEPLNVVHRDVSPQNILVSWAGEVKLIDFGLALSVLKDEHTATGAVMGKIAYMPPEQARGDEVDPRCDQFATAVIVYELLAGERYYGDLPLHAIWSIAGMGNFPPPRWSSIRPEVQAILQRALQNDPLKRYDSCSDMREALRAYMAQHHPATSERTLRELLDKWFKEHRAEERELLAQFRDVTGASVREAVKATETEVESLLSGPHVRPGPAPWLSSPLDALPGAEALRPESSLRIEGSGMPAPWQGSASGSGVAPGSGVAAGLSPPAFGAAMPGPIPTPGPAPIPVPLRVLSAPLGVEPSQPALPVPAPVLTGAGLPVLGPPGSAPRPFALNGPTAAAASRSRPVGTSQLKPDPEPTERVLRAVAAAQRRSRLVFAAAAGALALLVVGLVVMGNRSEPASSAEGASSPSLSAAVSPPTTQNPPAPAPAPTAPTAPTPTASPSLLPSAAPEAGPATPTRAESSRGTSTAVVRKRGEDHGKRPPREPAPPASDAPPPSVPQPTAPTAAAPAESRAATRARSRIGALQRSGCMDPCVGSVVGQYETMPAAVELSGFQTSVDACVKACQAN